MPEESAYQTIPQNEEFASWAWAQLLLVWCRIIHLPVCLRVVQSGFCFTSSLKHPNKQGMCTLNDILCSRQHTVRGVPCVFVNTRQKRRQQTPTQSAVSWETFLVSPPALWLLLSVLELELWAQGSLWKGPGLAHTWRGGTGKGFRWGIPARERLSF